MDAHTFTRKARSLLTGLLDESGAVLYSAPETLRCGPLYIMGINPGGSVGPTIREELHTFPKRTCNYYLDQDWYDGSGKRAGQYPLQRRLHCLMRRLGYDLRQVCASNLIFTRSRGQGAAGGWKRADACWDVHQLLLNTVQPAAIITYGKLPFEYVLERSEEVLEKVSECKSGHDNWTCRAAQIVLCGRETIHIGVPHLSRYDITTKAPVLDWIDDLLKNTRRLPGNVQQTQDRPDNSDPCISPSDPV